MTAYLSFLLELSPILPRRKKLLPMFKFMCVLKVWKCNMSTFNSTDQWFDGINQIVRMVGKAPLRSQ